MVFFGQAEKPGAMTWFLRDGFRHVAAAAWFDKTRRWVFFDPARNGTQIVVLDNATGLVKLERWMACSSAILAVVSNPVRNRPPPFAYCVGHVKALLGLRSRALSPRGLFQHLVRHGAEILRAPEHSHGLAVRQEAPRGPERG